MRKFLLVLAIPALAACSSENSGSKGQLLGYEEGVQDNGNGTILINGEPQGSSGSAGDINITINLEVTNENDNTITVTENDTSVDNSTTCNVNNAGDNSSDNITCDNSTAIDWQWWRGELIRTRF